jgi:hypothetical protein
MRRVARRRKTNRRIWQLTRSRQPSNGQGALLARCPQLEISGFSGGQCASEIEGLLSENRRWHT